MDRNYLLEKVVVQNCEKDWVNLILVWLVIFQLVVQEPILVKK